MNRIGVDVAGCTLLLVTLGAGALPTKGKPMTTEQATQMTEWIRQLAGGTIFSLLFRKRTDGTLRQMVCRLGVTAKLTGTGQRFNPTEYGLLVVYEMAAAQYRCVSLDAIEWLKIRGRVYK